MCTYVHRCWERCGPKSRTERPRKTKIGIGVAHVTRTPLSRSTGQKSRSQAALLTAAFTHQAAATVTVGTYCYVAVCRRGLLGGARRFGIHRGRRGAGHIVAAPAQLVRYVATYCRLDSLICWQTNELVVLRHLICGEYGCRIRQICVYRNPLQHRKIIELFLCSW